MRFILFFLVFFPSLARSSGENQSIPAQVEKRMERAKSYLKVFLYVEALEELNSLIQEGDRKNNELLKITASIQLGELKRLTGDMVEGYRILEELHIPEEYPLLQVRKLGRMAALSTEGANRSLPHEESRAIVLDLINKGMELAHRHNLKAELAGLYNELGYTFRNENNDTGLFCFEKASKLFLEVGDTQNYISARSNELRIYYNTKELGKAEKLSDYLYNLAQGKGWYRTETNLYQIICAFYEGTSDTQSANTWKMRLLQSTVNFIDKNSSSQLLAYRVLFETQNYQDEAEKSATELKKESLKSRNLFFYFFILLAVLLLIGTLLIRERKLKKAVKIANDKYHLLLIESNHRIKNNLQMIISMLNFAGKSVKDRDSWAFKSISGKVHTISALHKHLYLDVHNEKVNLNAYFKDIIGLYQDMTNTKYQIEFSSDRILIPSERIVYFGLILNEMLSNTVEHGNSDKLKILISVTAKNDHFLFSYQDFSKFILDDSSGTGTDLILQLTDRIEALNFKSDGDTGHYQFEFYA